MTQITTRLVRMFFFLLSLLFMVVYAIGIEHTPSLWAYVWGSALGVIVFACLLGLDLLFKQSNLKSFNTLVLGIFFGYLMALGLTLVFDTLVEMSGLQPGHFFAGLVKILLFLAALFLGVSSTLRASNEFYASIPFIKFTEKRQIVKDILLDTSALYDPRLIDFATSGLLDKRVVLPRFLLQELHQMQEGGDEGDAIKAKRALEVIKTLETIPEFFLRYHDTDFPGIKDSPAKTMRLARLLGADILLADINRIHMPHVEGIRIINLHMLAQALKPLMRHGELLKIKIQRFGKEERQGVGYLEDGTMVVVNGGGDFIGETINTYVLSVKHTQSGRMIFCNVTEDKHSHYEHESLSPR